MNLNIVGLKLKVDGPSLKQSNNETGQSLFFNFKRNLARVNNITTNQSLEKHIFFVILRVVNMQMELVKFP